MPDDRATRDRQPRSYTPGRASQGMPVPTVVRRGGRVMSDLTTFRDHCRKMAEWEATERLTTGTWCIDYATKYPGLDTVCLTPKHENCSWDQCACECHPLEVGPTETERALFGRLADEIDDHLAAVDEAEPLDLMGDTNVAR